MCWTSIFNDLIVVTNLVLPMSLPQFYLTGLSALPYKVSKSKEYLARKQLGSQARTLATTLVSEHVRTVTVTSLNIVWGFLVGLLSFKTNKTRSGLESGPAGTQPGNAVLCQVRLAKMKPSAGWFMWKEGRQPASLPIQAVL